MQNRKLLVSLGALVWLAGIMGAVLTGAWAGSWVGIVFGALVLVWTVARYWVLTVAMDRATTLLGVDCYGILGLVLLLVELVSMYLAVVLTGPGALWAVVLSVCGAALVGSGLRTQIK